MTDHSPRTRGPRSPARPRPLAEREERCAPAADDDADDAPGAPDTRRAHTSARERVDLAHSYDRLRAGLAALRRSRDPEVRAAGEGIAAEAAAAVVALAERAREADPAVQRQRERLAARTARLTAQLDDAIAARGARRADG